MDDLIRRQTAIDELKKGRALFCDNTPESFSRLSYGDKCRVDEIDNAIAVLVNLPPAQQEIIRCKDCRYNDLEEQTATTRWLPCIDAAWPDDWFCGCAERRKES